MMIPFEALGVAAALLLLALAMLHMHYSPRSEWRFTPMLMTHRDGQPVPDRQAFVMLGAFFVSTIWGTVMVAKGQMTEWFYGFYMLAWAGSHFGSRYLKVKGGRTHG